MCLAIPAQILSVRGSSAELDMAGNRLSADISMVPDAVPGDFVMVHAGFAIQKYDETEALATLDILREYAEQLNGKTA
jgi:hydrogenase expression/formation protein HypC